MSYGGDPTTTTRDDVRFRLGDTDTANEILTDTEIDALLTQFTSVPLAAAQGCLRIIAEFARDIDRSGLGMRATRSQKVQHYRDLYTSLLRESNKNVEISVGGLSISEKDSFGEDTDAVQPAFEVGQDDFVRASDRRRDPGA